MGPIHAPIVLPYSFSQSFMNLARNKERVLLIQTFLIIYGIMGCLQQFAVKEKEKIDNKRACFMYWKERRGDVVVVGGGCLLLMIETHFLPYDFYLQPFPFVDII